MRCKLCGSTDIIKQDTGTGVLIDVCYTCGNSSKEDMEVLKKKTNKLDFKEFVVGAPFNGVAIVAEATTRQTKAKKDFLSIKLFDGKNYISGNKWDTSEKFNKNDIVLVKGTVGEYNGNKQINVTTISKTNELAIEDFLENQLGDLERYLTLKNSLVSNMQHQGLKDLVNAVYNDLAHRLNKAPGAKAVHHAYVGGLLQHMVDVADTAKMLACKYNAESDIVVTSALLHDIGKIFEYKVDGVTIDTTLDGYMLSHIPMGNIIIEKFAGQIELPRPITKVIQHCVLAHHGCLEFGSPVEPLCLEAWCVHIADNIDAKANTIWAINEGVTTHLTEKCFSLGNKPQISQHYVSTTLQG